MQKIARRTAEAQRNAAARAKKKSLNAYREAKHSRRRETKSTLADVSDDIRNARKFRKEDYELGPIAPLRNIEGNLSNLAMKGSRMSSSSPLKNWEIEARCAWAGGPKNLNITEGDRVVVMQGPHKGTIDKIDSINMDTATVTLENSAKRLVRIPEMYLGLDPNQPEITAVPTHLPISAIRLVHPLQDPKTGITRDVIIRSLTHGKIIHHRHLSVRRWTRFITGLNVAIPWPKREPKTYDDEPADTRRMYVEATTFTPTLLRPPMPGGVIDELRNRYSKFRTRHEQEFIERKQAEEDERRNSRKLQRDMYTPLQEFNKQERDIRRAHGAPELSDYMLAKIGEVIARNKAEQAKAKRFVARSKAPAAHTIEASSAAATQTSAPPP